MKGNNPVRSNQRTPGIPIIAQPLIGMVRIQEYKVHGMTPRKREIPCCSNAGRAYPSNRAVMDLAYLFAGNVPLSAKAQSSDRVRINRDQHTVRGHFGAQATCCHSVPNSNFDWTLPATNVAGQANPFPGGGFCLHSLPPPPPQQKIEKRPPRFSTRFTHKKRYSAHRGFH